MIANNCLYCGGVLFDEDFAFCNDACWDEWLDARLTEIAIAERAGDCE